MKAYFHDGETIKWRHDGHNYMVVIHDDMNPMDPREWDNVGTMACFHRRYSLGDDIKYSDPLDYWQHLVCELVSAQEVFDAVKNGKLAGIRIEPGESDGCWDVFETCYLAGWQTSKEAEEYLEYSDIPTLQIADYIRDDLTISHCQILVEPHAEWLNLYFYDHSGITMSCGDANPFSCRWDSGCVGWYIVTKEEALKELGRISEENWRECVDEYIRNEVEIYDQYLTGDVYGFELFEYPDLEDDEELTDDDLEDVDSCWGFYGDDVLENGICDYCPGLREALESNNYASGERVSHTTTYYTY